MKTPSELLRARQQKTSGNGCVKLRNNEIVLQIEGNEPSSRTVQQEACSSTGNAEDEDVCVVIKSYPAINCTTAQENLEEDYARQRTALNELLPFMQRLRTGYETAHGMYRKVANDFNEQTGQVNLLNKKVQSQTARISTMAEALDRLKSENKEFRNKHNTFVLYKKEVGKYIEILRNAMNGRNDEMDALCTQNSELKQEISRGEYEIDILRREAAERRMVLDDLAREKRLVDEQLESLRCQIRTVDRTVQEYATRYRGMEHSRYSRQNVLYEGAIGMIKSEIFFMIKKWAAVAEGIAVLKGAYATEHESHQALTKYTEGLEKQIEQMNADYQMQIAGAVEALDTERNTARGRMERMEEERGAMMAALIEQTRAGMRAKLQGLKEAVEALEKQVVDCKSKRKTGCDEKTMEVLKRSHAGIMESQQKMYETQKMQYQSRIAELTQRIDNLQKSMKKESELPGGSPRKNDGPQRSTRKRKPHRYMSQGADTSTEDSNMWDVFH